MFAWRVTAAFGHPAWPLRRTVLGPRRHYHDEDTGTVRSGVVLLARGLNLDFLPGDHASVLVHLRRVRRPDHGLAALTNRS